MVRCFCFRDDDGFMIQNIDATGVLPNTVAGIRIDGPFDYNSNKCKTLTNLLKGSPRKLQSIELDSIAEESPEFLAFLVLICSKTESLRFSDFLLSSHATGCLIGALLMHGGIHSLSISHDDANGPFPTTQAKILLQGVASSPCLEKFRFSVFGFEDNQAVARYLIRALKGHQTLKEIYIDASPFAGQDSTFFSKLLKAAILGSAKVKSACIKDSQRELRFDELQDILYDKRCVLEKLHLDGVEISTDAYDDDVWFGSIVQNISVKSLSITSCSPRSRVMKDIVGLFKSLEDLDLYGAGVTELSFLDPLLFGETSQLKSLRFTYNERIGQGEMERFIAKLRKITGLKSFIVFDSNSDLSDSLKTAMTDALRHNPDLEHFVLCVDVRFYNHDLPLDLNRAGRRLFESPDPLPRNLLPLVLERASKISYYKIDDTWGHPTNKEVRADVVYWMMHRIAPQL